MTLSLLNFVRASCDMCMQQTLGLQVALFFDETCFLEAKHDRHMRAEEHQATSKKTCVTQTLTRRTWQLHR